MSATNDSNESTGPQPETKPDLKVVEGAGQPAASAEPVDEAAPTEEAAASEQPADEAAAPPPSPAAAEAPPSRSRLPLILGLALALAIVFALLQGQRADRLADQIEALEAELDLVGAELAAHRKHLARVRTAVDDLASRAQAVSDLAHAAPGTTEPEAGASPEAGQGEPAPEPAPEASPGVVDF